jgi:hypothetical protein
MVKAFGHTIDMKPPMFFNNPMNVYLTIMNEDPIEEMATEILPSKYNLVDTNEVASNQKHLSTEKKSVLADLLKDFLTLFNGKLGEYKHQKIHLDVQSLCCTLCSSQGLQGRVKPLGCNWSTISYWSF